MADDSLKSFEDLKCWQACREKLNFITELIKGYPKDEQYSIVDNMKRAARSTTQNIAEGCGRFHYKKNLQFCRISRGLSFELTDKLITSIDEGFITKEDYDLGRHNISNALTQ